MNHPSNPPLAPEKSLHPPLNAWQRRGLIAFFAAVVLFGGVVEYRSAFLQRPLTDLQVYLRAAWAVRIDYDPYIITDQSGWHYNYPPLLAIVLTPLADPPPIVEDRTGYLPFGVTVAVWYLLSLGCLFYAVHALASALEATSPDPRLRKQPQGCRRWWALRILPVLACLPPICHTLMRGQVNLILLALLAGMAAATVRRQNFRAGLFLAGAICIKIIPVFLLLFPLWRRDGRCLVGCFVGLVIGLGVIPGAVFGPERTIGYYREFTEGVLLPGLARGGDQSRAEELINQTGTHSQSLVSTLHNTLNRDPATRPPRAEPALRMVHWLIGAILTIWTLALAGWRRERKGREAALFLGALILIMLLISPVSHLHYFCLAVPALLALTAGIYERSATGQLGRGWLALFGVNLLLNLAPQIPRLSWLRDLGPVTYATLALWAITAVALLGAGQKIMPKNKNKTKRGGGIATRWRSRLAMR